MPARRLTRPLRLTARQAQVLDDYALRRHQPLPLFEALAHSDTALDDLVAGTDAAISRSRLPVRLREILILRTLARWQARAEWDVHVLLYAPVAPLSAAELHWLAGGQGRVVWRAEEKLLIDLADALHRDTAVEDNLWQALQHVFGAPACAEILMTATQYVKVALLTRALALPPLSGGPALPFQNGASS